MASHIKMGESLLIPFRNGISISDSQLKPRMYKSRQAFEKAFPKHYLGTDGVGLVEYAPVVRCKDCKSLYITSSGHRFCRNYFTFPVKEDDYCSYGERRCDNEVD